MRGAGKGVKGGAGRGKGGGGWGVLRRILIIWEYAGMYTDIQG